MKKIWAAFIFIFVLLFSSYSESECRLCEENGLPLEVWTLDGIDQILALDPYISGVTSNCLIAEDILAKTTS